MLTRLLIANRGEIAIRIARTAAEMGIATVAVYSQDDAQSLHVREADQAVALRLSGAAAYLAIDQIIAAARATGCDAIHPGYGFLAENAAFALACVEAGVAFVGPSAETLALFGDKSNARAHAERCGVRVLPGTQGPTSLLDARSFLTKLGPKGAVMLKALAGGGGRGMRPVTTPEQLDAAYAACRAEAESAFGDGAVYVEQLFAAARHIEVQLVGDGSGRVSHIGERECSLQRRRQKLVEWAPAERLDPAMRENLLAGAVRMGETAKLRSLATVEFLVGPDDYAFIEINPRIQVEHTVTEEVTRLDLVRIQLDLACGGTLASLGIDQARVPPPRGTALQARINLETMVADGSARPSSGRLSAYSVPAGRGVRIDGFGYLGYQTSLAFDALLAKLVVSVPAGGLAAAAAKATRELARFDIGGVQTNIAFLRALLSDPDVIAGKASTGFIDERLGPLIAAQEVLEPLTRESESGEPHNAVTAPAGCVAVTASMLGKLVSCTVKPGDQVIAGQEVAVLEAMKMQHGLTAPTGGTVITLIAAIGDTLSQGDPIVFIEASERGAEAAGDQIAPVDPDFIRPDLREIKERRRGTGDEARPEAVARRRKTGQRTTRENIDDLFDDGSFIEYGGLVLAGRSRRATTEELILSSPADGLVMGLGTVNAQLFGEEPGKIAAMAYDYTVFAGTQGARNHTKTDRLIELADRWKIPLVLFAEGGGGRPGDTDGGGFIRAFELFGKLSGRVPMVGVVSGRCFAGNASLLGCCDVIIATRNVTMGMGGPAMIEGGGLGVYTPEEVGPAAVHAKNGVIDVLVDDEVAAVAIVKQYLAYFQGSLATWDCADQRELRHIISENRLRIYDVRAVLDRLADSGSVLELRRDFGLAMVTALARIEGRAVGIIANNPAHLGGAIDSDAADKAARFLQLCEGHGLPVLSLSDTPGIMVGPEVEKTALIRHAARMFVIGANLTVPLLSVVLRKSYGLGAIAMTGGSYQASLFAVAWPTGEFGGMGLEGAVKLGYRKELEAIADPSERQAKYDEMVARLYQHGKALSVAGYFGIDDVIDPADTRRWILNALRAAPAPPPSGTKRIPWIDPW